MGILTVHGNFKFLILVFNVSEICLFVFVLDAIFCGTSFFFHFSGHCVAS